MIKKIISVHNTGYTSGGFQSNLQAPGSLARAVTVDNESATEPARCIPSTLAATLKTSRTDKANMSRIGFYIKIEVDKGQKTILEIASQLSQLLIGLAKVDTRFTDLYYLTSDSKKNERFNPIDSSELELRDQLSDWILKYHKGEIKKYNKGVNLTVDFSESVGFVNTFMTPNRNENKSVLWTILGSDRYNHLRLELPRKRIENLDWYTEVLGVFIQTFNPIFGGVFLDIQLKNNPQYFPGLITYMRQDFDKPEIPDFVKNVNYFNGGLYYFMDKVWDSTLQEENEIFKTFLLKFYEKNAAANTAYK